MQKKNETKKSGFAVLIGRSNVGKSTLLNSLVGSKVAITTPKPQTTRLPIQGILTEERGQIVFVDTPGVFKQSKDLLSKKLLHYVEESLKGIDVVVYVVDPTRSIGAEERSVLHMMRELKVPVIYVINKTDLHRTPYLDAYRDLSDEFETTIEVSAETRSNLNILVDEIFENLPEGEFLYPEGQFTNLPNEIWVAEIIREKLFLRLRQEVPYSVHVIVDEIAKRDNGMVYIKARILTLEERYQRMIIGAGGQGVKEIGQSVRRELQTVMGGKVFIDLNVEVNQHWMEEFI